MSLTLCISINAFCSTTNPNFSLLTPFSQVNFTDAKIRDISDDILRESFLYDDDITADNIIIGGALSCNADPPNSVIFSARMREVSSRNSSDLLTGILAWVADGPVISVLGVLMQVGGECGTTDTNLGSGSCDREDFLCIVTPSLTRLASTQAVIVSPTDTIPATSAVPMESIGPPTCDCSQSLTLSGLLLVVVPVAIAVIGVIGVAVIILFWGMRCRKGRMRNYKSNE